MLRLIASLGAPAAQLEQLLLVRTPRLLVHLLDVSCPELLHGELRMLLDLEPLVLHLMRDAIRRNQTQSDVIRGSSTLSLWYCTLS
jgi:hypothetical protein